MSTFHVNFKNAMLDAISPVSMRLHDGDPGSSGTNNQVYEDVSPAELAQEACSFADASGGERAPEANVEFTNLEANQNVTWFSVWTAGNDFVGKGKITEGDTSANSAGEFTVTTQSKLQLLDPS